MPSFAANLSMLYNEHEFLDRFAAAAQDGFKAVEFLFPYAYDAKELRQRLDVARHPGGASLMTLTALGVAVALLVILLVPIMLYQRQQLRQMETR